MAAPRPGFARRDTDGVSLKDLNASAKATHASSSDKGNDDKEGAVVEVSGRDDADLQKPDHGDYAPPDYVGDNDGFNHVTRPVETAKDLTTQVLHVQDDPTLSPYTFRLFFLGMH